MQNVRRHLIYRRSYTDPRLCSRRSGLRADRGLLTFGADAPHPQAVMSGAKSKAARHLVLHVLYRRREKFDHPAAIGADHVVVVLVIVMVLIVCLVIAKPNLACEACLGKEL